MVFKNAAASQAHSLCWSNYVGVLGKKKKAKQLEKGLAVGKPKLKDLEEAEQLSSPGGGHASRVCKSLEQLLASPGNFGVQVSHPCAKSPPLHHPAVKLLPDGVVPSLWHCMRHRSAYFSQNLKSALVKGFSDHRRM